MAVNRHFFSNRRKTIKIHSLKLHLKEAAANGCSTVEEKKDLWALLFSVIVQ